MTLISNDPSWWPSINADRIASYFAGLWCICWMMTAMCRSNLDCGFVVAAFAGLIYDCVLTFGQEVELIWVSRVSRQRNNLNNS
ncbi:hypothetical protein DFH29DRAFT_963108 [Suillus ampliporus]|nr:hypothetical protein DFH29DRAFT_963108 [Suillus ampliporus]